MNELALLVIPAAHVGVAVEASRVEQIVPERQWHSTQWIDLVRLVTGAEAPSSDESRILVITRRRAEPLIVRTLGNLRIQTVPHTAPLPLPELLAHYARAIRAVVFSEKTKPLLLLDPDALVL